MNAGVVMALAGVVFLPGAASAQVLVRRCAADSLEPSQTEARVEWMRRCALAKVVSSKEAFDTGTPSSSGGSLYDYMEPSPEPWSGKNMYTGLMIAEGAINTTYVFSLYNSSPTSQSVDVNGYYKWARPITRKRLRPLYPTYGSEVDINSATNQPLFPHPTLATCGFYFDRNGMQPAPASQSFYANGFCESLPPSTALTSGVPLGVSGAAGSSQYYSLSVPAGAVSVAFETSGGTGDVDLYVRHNAIPDTTLYDCRPYINGSNELCNMPSPAAGTWRVMLKGYTDYSGVTLKSFIYNGLTDGVPSAAVSGAQGSEQYWVLDVPAGMSKLTVTLAGVAGSTGDADLYVRHTLAPILTAYDCRPYIGGNSEVCTFDAPAEGTWYVMARGWSAYSGVTVTGDYY